MEKEYCLNKKEFVKLYNLSQNIYRISMVVLHFCEDFDSIEDAENIIPVVKYLTQETDSLLFEFAELDIKGASGDDLF